MASIQILELRPVEAHIEDLSYDMTGSIVGGIEPTYFDCVGNFLKDLGRELTNPFLNPGNVLAIIGEYYSCIALLPPPA